MNDFDGLLATDFGFKPQGKAAPMAASKGSSNITTSNSLNFDLASRSASQFTRNSNSVSGNFVDDSDSLFGSSGNRKNRDTDGFGDLFGGSARFTSKSESLRPDSSFNLGSMFHGSRDFGSKSMNSPVYDKPVYDDDIFDGVSGLKTSSKVKYDEVFASVSSAPEGSDGAFDDLLGGFGRAERESKSSGGRRPEKNDYSVPNFDDLIPGFGGGRPPSDRPSPDIGLSSEPTASASRTTSSMTEDPFKVFESKDSSSGHFTDPLEEISKFSSSRSTKNDSSLNSNGRVYDGVDPFDGLGKSVPAFSSERNNKKDSSRPRTNISTSWTQNKEPVEKSSVRSPEKHSQNKILVGHNREFEQMPFDMPAYSSDYDKPVGQRASSPSNNNADFGEANVQVDMSPKYEENLESYDNVWLTVSEIPLFTQPTTAPPPSRPPPPRPVHVPKSGTGSASSTNIKKKATEFSSFPSSTQFSQGLKSDPAATRASSASQFDELEDFAMGRSHGSDDELGNGLPNEELEINSAAAAMKEAMDRAEAKFRHAKEVRGRENTKAAKGREAVQEDRGKQERLDCERQQQDRKEKEQRRLEKEREGEEREREQRLERERERAREFEREREKARQAVERATREARERAAAEARLRAERAAVEKANAEARERAERAAVQRAQAEARERAAAEAKERVERAAQARERANTEAKEKEARERAAAARAEAEARVRAEKRAAVERATAEARERAAAAVRMNNQKNENDLESFFSMGTRTSSAPRPPRANSSDSLFDTQFQPDTTRKSTNTSSGMKKASSSTNIVDDLSSIFGAAPSSGEFQEVEGESEERRRARLERHQRAQERAAKALAEKNQRDLQTQREQAERHRLAETLDSEIKRWAAGKEGNLRALLSTLQYVLWPECGWQPVSLTDLITAASVKKVYRKATLCIHPDKVQQKGANLQQKYISEKVFDILKEAWNKFNSEELF